MTKQHIYDELVKVRDNIISDPVEAKNILDNILRSIVSDLRYFDDSAKETKIKGILYTMQREVLNTPLAVPVLGTLTAWKYNGKYYYMNKYTVIQMDYLFDGADAVMPSDNITGLIDGITAHSKLKGVLLTNIECPEFDKVAAMNKRSHRENDCQMCFKFGNGVSISVENMWRAMTITGSRKCYTSRINENMNKDRSIIIFNGDDITVYVLPVVCNTPESTRGHFYIPYHEDADCGE